MGERVVDWYYTKGPHFHLYHGVNKLQALLGAALLILKQLVFAPTP